MAVGSIGSIKSIKSGETGELNIVAGVRVSTVSAGIKIAGRLDVVLFEICEGGTTAGIFTQNAFCAAPVTVAKKHLSTCQPRFFLVNTGNANAGTGTKGELDALTCCSILAAQNEISTEQVLPFSTGVIGEPLPVEKITAVFSELCSSLESEPWLDAAKGIMTTDTRPKAVSKQVKLDGKIVTITGIAKGAGMIKPNMATMLAYVFTDAEVKQASLQSMIEESSNKSFNRISVDGDTSTNDCCMLVATGKSSVAIDELATTDKQVFISALEEVFISLAQGLIRDAEGASKFVNVRVESGLSREESLQVAYTISESPLVKTALFASDPNWGRILAAVGRAGVPDLDVSKIEIWLDDVCIVNHGAVSESYTETKGQAVMDKDEITITIKLGRGDAVENVWTCDLSHDYVTINAEYRT